VSGVAAIAGLTAEAAVARRAGVEMAAGGVGPEAAGALARQFAREGARGLVSFGIAGGLAPDLNPGALILGDAVIVGEGRYPCVPAWLARAQARLPAARVGAIMASTRIVGTRAEKRALAEGGALAVDMESGAVAAVAREFGLPFLVLRAVADRADDEIPPAAAAALLPGQGARAFTLALMRRPQAVPALVRLGWRTGIGLRALSRAARALGADLTCA
jgi:hopanoid-associated phosphorylase